MPKPPPSSLHRPDDIEALVHALEVHQAELEQQNLELTAANEALRHTNLALAAAHDRYRALHDLAPAPLITIDSAGLIVDVNQAAEVLLRAAGPHLRGRRLAVFVAEADRAALHAWIVALFATGSADGRALGLVVGEAIAIDVELAGVVLREPGEVRAVLALIDLTAERRAEEERRRHQHERAQTQRLESLGVLAGGIAHDFSNLLTVILGGTDHVLHALGADTELAAPLVEVYQAARHAGALAHQMLAYSGQGSTPAQVTDLGALIHALEPLLRASAQTTPLILAIPAELPATLADEAQLRQVALNLVINAAEAMRGRPGAIVVAIGTESLAAADLAALPLATELVPGRYLVLEVRDDGVGMDAATQGRIYEPYFSTKFIGRGLGLAVVHGIVRGHGGVLAVDSALDRGTRFRVYLPTTTARPPVAPVVSPPVAIAGASGRVLIVDDDPGIRRMLARIVTGLGLTAITAADGADALARIDDGADFDLVLMDLAMPGLGGVEAATAIRARQPALPIVLITGYGEIPPAEGSVFAAMLAKPFDLTAVRRVIQQLLPR